MIFRDKIILLAGSWRKSLVMALIVICLVMVVASLALIALYLLKSNTEIGEWLFVLVLSVFNIFLLYSFL